MSKKSDSCYFQGFIGCVGCGHQAAKILEGNLNHFDTGLLQGKSDELHRIRHDVDKKEHEIMAALVKTFITSTEREDIALLSQSIDEVTDKIENVLIRIYVNSVQQIYSGAPTSIKVTTRCCEVPKEVVEEFADFRKSKTFHGLIIETNALEGEGNQLLTEPMHRLHAEATDPIEITAWRKIYVYLEECYDACEHVTDVVKSVIAENT